MSGTVVRPWQPIRELGLTELIGINEQVDQNNFCGSVGIALPTLCSGEILSILLIQTESGSGAILSDLAGKLYIFDADPTIASGDTSFTAAEGQTLVAVVDVANGDWVIDTNSAVAFIVDTPVAFHRLSTLYFAFKSTGATSINSAAGDDELLQINAWIRIDS